MTNYEDLFDSDREAEREAIELAARSGVAYADLRSIVIPDHILALVPRHVALGERVLPYGEDGASLVVILSNPLDREFRDKLQFILNRPVSVAVAPQSYIDAAIKWYYGDNP